MKSDSSIKNICTAAAKRHTIKPINFPLTTLFENDSIKLISDQVHLLAGELLIMQTFMSSSDWTLITTRRIISSFDRIMQEVVPEKINSWNWGDFKGYVSKQTSIGELRLANGSSFRIHIETGKASMVIIYAVITLVRLSEKQL